ncbi:hypothetical protein MRX96_030553 [Rhipicephalus microplus]
MERNAIRAVKITADLLSKDEDYVQSKPSVSKIWCAVLGPGTGVTTVDVASKLTAATAATGADLERTIPDPRGRPNRGLWPAAPSP